MTDYWQDPVPITSENPGPAAAEDSPHNTQVQTIESEFDHHCCELIQQSSPQSYNGGWAAELHHYLGDLPADKTIEGY